MEKTVDALIARMIVTTDPAERARLGGEIWERLQADMNARRPGAKCECGTPIIGAAYRCLVCCLRTAGTAPQELL